ncbi:spermidine/putrescine transport system substrate-binding protein [Anaerobacterium chartisolvens]|uniref:Spermidine/putrescine transport system substrate-binding protein n=1 Tax=Anaerobacterium chartisolvens TaxID=1297424 RepID=A0A369AWI6_9FIRM|nr:ABC transporter substrate-binding protein [Anaerobacterium chartisolvens]RCX13473.1 spermidine/putrescine transport system substrate-binding protein [Anaerobacterium chartisolvens]
MKKVCCFVVFLIISAASVFLMSGCSESYKATIKVYNWGDYIDKDVLESFTTEHNIKVIYSEFATNEDMYAKLKAGGEDYDVVIPSDYMIKRMINDDILYKIDLNNIPNYKLIDDRFKNLAYDRENEYSVPYMWGTVGLLYNKKMVDDVVDSWSILWNEKYKKQILMLDSQRDSIGITLKMLGHSLNSKDEAQLEEAKEMLMDQKPLVLAYVGDAVKDKMIGGEAALAVVWSGDAIYMKRENPDLEYVIPKEGSNIWFDAMVIPKTSKNKKEAELFIDYMCRTDIALKNAEFIGFSTPHTEVKSQLPVELTSDKTVYPGVDDLSNSEVFEDLSDTLSIYDRIWTEIKAK